LFELLANRTTQPAHNLITLVFFGTADVTGIHLTVAIAIAIVIARANAVAVAGVLINFNCQTHLRSSNIPITN